MPTQVPEAVLDDMYRPAHYKRWPEQNLNVTRSSIQQRREPVVTATDCVRRVT